MLFICLHFVKSLLSSYKMERSERESIAGRSSGRIRCENALLPVLKPTSSSPSFFILISFWNFYSIFYNIPLWIHCGCLEEVNTIDPCFGKNRNRREPVETTHTVASLIFSPRLLFNLSKLSDVLLPVGEEEEQQTSRSQSSILYKCNISPRENALNRFVLGNPNY